MWIYIGWVMRVIEVDGTMLMIVDWDRLLLHCVRLVRVIIGVVILVGVDHAVIAE